MSDCLRERIRSERERHGWSQRKLAIMVTGQGLLCYGPTIAKIEAGDRAVQVDELCVFADLFGVSVDALIGRRRSSELAWAASNLTSNAQKMAGDIAALRARLRGGLDDVRAATNSGGAAADNLIEIAGTTLIQLGDAQEWLNRLANQFPIPTGR